MFDSCTTAHRKYKDIADALNDGSICMSEKEGVNLFYKHTKNLEKFGFNKNVMFPIVLCATGLYDKENIESIEFKEEIDRMPEYIKELEAKYDLAIHDEL